MQKWAIIGYSGALADILDAISSQSACLSEIILNMPVDREQLAQDLIPLKYSVKISEWDNCSFSSEYAYQFGFVSPQKKMIVTELKNKFNLQFGTLLHASATISPYATLGEGVLIGAHTVVTAFAKINEFVRLNRMVSVGHHSDIGAHCHIGPGVTVTGHCTIGEGTFIGAGSILRDHVRIGNNVLIGAGSVVVKDIPDNMVAMGNPARVIRENITVALE